MTELQIKLQNIWNAVSIGVFTDDNETFVPDYKNILTGDVRKDGCDTKERNKFSYIKSDNKDIERLVDAAYKIDIDFNVHSFINLLCDNDKEKLLRQLGHNIGFDKAYSILEDQEKYIEEGEYE
jgi:hypothetical protein